MRASWDGARRTSGTPTRTGPARGSCSALPPVGRDAGLRRRWAAAQAVRGGLRSNWRAAQVDGSAQSERQAGAAQQCGGSRRGD
eukprot:717518-Prymnesium_polylepis.1